MDKECGMHQILEINLTAGNGAEKIIQEIAASPLWEKLILRDDKVLGKEWYGEHLVNYLEFFTPKEGLADTAELLEKLFPMESPDDEGLGKEGEGADYSQGTGKEGEGGQPETAGEEGTGNSNGPKEVQDGPEECRIFLYQELEGNWKAQGKNPRIYLKVVKLPFQIPFVLELIPFEGVTMPLQEKALEGALQEEPVTYRMFTAEEYLSRSFYHIMEDLELVYSLSWYRDIYRILTEHVVEGRKVSQSFGQLILEHTIPRLEERLEIISSFEEYGYMQKRWENFCKRTSCASQQEEEPEGQREAEDGRSLKGQPSDEKQLEEEAGGQRETEDGRSLKGKPSDEKQQEEGTEGQRETEDGRSLKGQPSDEKQQEEEAGGQRGAEDGRSLKGQPSDEKQQEEEAETGHGTGETGDSHGLAEEPEWGQVIQIMVKFFSPVIEAALRDELFIGDWMPQFGKYLG